MGPGRRERSEPSRPRRRLLRPPRSAPAPAPAPTRPPMAEPGAEETDERLLLLAEPPPPPEAELPRRGPQSARAAPGGAVRQCGEPGLEEVQDSEESEESGPEGDGEDEPLLRTPGSGRGRRAGAAWDRERRGAAGTARERRGRQRGSGRASGALTAPALLRASSRAADIPVGTQVRSMCRVRWHSVGEGQSMGSLTDNERKMLQMDRNSPTLSPGAGLHELIFMMVYIYMRVSTVTSPRSVCCFVGPCFVSVMLLETCGFACFKDCFVVGLATAS